MYIKEITIEGFKSYAQTTIINDFDPHFNAITGLNGSGKSNILDSICFVLGISNLTHVRATNLQELIYKGGNAGITKASVSITFDNSDKNQSPFGYHDYEAITITRQISVGGKQKYLINGQNATSQRVSDLFCSVQLNVNNPNFLIMQGKITKVLNMKPAEILSMIEEAAGTKTYDMKKANALQTIEKKNAKLNEIERVLREDITPMIEKLEQEKRAYLEYKNCERELLHLQKVSVAFQFCQYEEGLEKIKGESLELENAFRTNEERIAEIKICADALKDEIKGLKEKMNGGDELLVEYEGKLKENQIKMAKLKSEMNNQLTSEKSEKKRITQVEKCINENRKIIESKEEKIVEMRSIREKARSELEKAETELKEAQQNYEALCCGLVLDSHTMGSVQDQLMHVGNKINQLQTQIKQEEIKLKSAIAESDKLGSEVDSSMKEYDEKLKEFEERKKCFTDMQTQLEKFEVDSSKFESMTNKRREMHSQFNSANEKIQEFYARYPQLNFEYNMKNQPDFDHNKVKGLVCTLFQVKDPKYATALEIAAGGKLYNLVVDSDQTGKLLLQYGELKRKITIIPMNQIRSSQISERTVKCAKDLVGESNVFSALSLVTYDPAYRQVMEYVFGTKFVCASLDAARRVAFHPQIMTSAITLDGDHFDPEGVLTGGSKSERGTFLAKLGEFYREKDQIKQLRKELDSLENSLNEEKRKLSEFTRRKREVDEVQSKMNSARMHLEQTSYHQKLEKVNGLKEEIEKRKKEIEKLSDELKVEKEKHSQLADKVKNHQGRSKDDEKKEAQREIQERKSFIENHQKLFNQEQQEYDSIKLEIGVLEKEIEAYNEELTKIEETLRTIEGEVKNIEGKLNTLKDEESEISEHVEKRKDLIREKNQLIHRKNAECDKYEKEKNSIELLIKELQHKKANLSEQLKQSNSRMQGLIAAHDWINEDRHLFGQANTTYEFKKYNMKEVQHRLHEIKNRKEKLSKQVNTRAMGMLSKKEEEYGELNKKRIIVLKDRATLETTIEDLEKIKTEVLKKAFESINRDFGNIFKTLLPGSFAKLEPCNKNSLLEGVEFKVAFGDVWKESLNELSGGQRSLVALSLILSLLLYKPAPLYILDEVDAALDTSHTQNIGLMIKKYFKASQFIIVSLKDGMFNNANVLFKTKLIDGVSTIQRHA